MWLDASSSPERVGNSGRGGFSLLSGALARAQAPAESFRDESTVQHYDAGNDGACRRLSTQSQNPLFGSVASGKATAEVLPLGALDAIDRGLKYNLSLLLSEQATTARAGRTLSRPGRRAADADRRASAESVQQINLAAFGIPRRRASAPIVGPFAVFDARVLASGSFLDLHALNLLRARTEDVNAATTRTAERARPDRAGGGRHVHAGAGRERRASFPWKPN